MRKYTTVKGWLKRLKWLANHEQDSLSGYEKLSPEQQKEIGFIMASIFNSLGDIELSKQRSDMK